MTGSTNKAVTWSVQEEAEGGSIDSNGLYKSPSSLTNEDTYHVVATSQADSTKVARATVTVIAAPISVRIDPQTASLVGGQTKQFTATVTGSTNKAVTWSVQEEAEGGSIDSNGLYKSPSSLTNEDTYHVVATSQADSTKVARAT